MNPHRFYQSRVKAAGSSDESTVILAEDSEEVALQATEQYSDLNCIGTGATSIVYSAKCGLTGSTVALKQLQRHLAANTQAVSDFLQEPKILLGISHPHIIRCFDFFFASDTWWIVLEYIPGGSLKSVLHRDAFCNDGRTSIWLDQIADAIRYLHSRQLIHRDVKPANILVDGARALLADFGYCCRYDEHVRKSRRIVGTPEYMSQAALQGVCSSNNDWFALNKSRQRVRSANYNVV